MQYNEKKMKKMKKMEKNTDTQPQCQQSNVRIIQNDQKICGAFYNCTRT